MVVRGAPDWGALEDARGVLLRIGRFPDVIRSAARNAEPSEVTNWLLGLSREINGWYAAHRVLGQDSGVTAGRLALVSASQVAVAAGLKLLGVAAPQEMADMLKKIHHGQILSAKSSEEMLGMLKDGRDRRMIPRYVKPEITIARKYGSNGIIKGNVGIIYLPSGPLVVAGFALGRPGNNAELGSVAIARVTRLSAAVVSSESRLEVEEE